MKTFTGEMNIYITILKMTNSSKVNWKIERFGNTQGIMSTQKSYIGGNKNVALFLHASKVL